MSREDANARLFAAIRAGDAAGVGRALEAGADPEAAGADGRTALMTAVFWSRLPLVRLLLARAADPGLRVEVALGEGAGGGLMLLEAAADCGDPEIARLLVEHGAPAGAFDGAILRELTGADRIAPVRVTREIFEAGRAARFGRTNPEPALEPFWQEQIRTGLDGYSAGRKPFLAGNAVYEPPPVWSFDRFGRTATRLADRRWVLIAGEHEDHYDPDFCIYNDVTVLDGGGGVAHYLYPREVFPPTDFHSATLLGDAILLVGSLGYREDRREGETQVMRLSLEDFSIARVETSGDNPGWINRHRASLEGGGRIVVSGGKLEPGYRDLEGRWALDLECWRWSRLED